MYEKTSLMRERRVRQNLATTEAHNWYQMPSDVADDYASVCESTGRGLSNMMGSQKYQLEKVLETTGIFVDPSIGLNDGSGFRSDSVVPVLA